MRWEGRGQDGTGQRPWLSHTLGSSRLKEWRSISIPFEEISGKCSQKENIMQARSVGGKMLGGGWGRGGYLRENASATRFCQLVTFDHDRCCYFLTSVFPAIWEQMSAKGHNLTWESLCAHPKLSPAARTARPQGRIV